MPGTVLLSPPHLSTGQERPHSPFGAPDTTPVVRPQGPSTSAAEEPSARTCWGLGWMEGLGRLQLPVD